MNASQMTRRFYQNNHVSTELGGSGTRSIFRNGDTPLAQRQSGADVSHTLMEVDRAGTVISEIGTSGREPFSYSPYGLRHAKSTSTNPLAFNGQLLDSATNGYLLGNGYRLFKPALKRFCSPDTLSPFGQGGLSSYAYCAGDPLNRVDPSGHIPRLKPLLAAALVTGIAGAAAGIAALTVKSESGREIAQISAIILGVATVSILVGAASSSRMFPSYIRRQASPVSTANPTGFPTDANAHGNFNFRNAADNLGMDPLRFANLPPQQGSSSSANYHDLPPPYLELFPGDDAPPPSYQEVQNSVARSQPEQIEMTPVRRNSVIRAS